MSDHKLCQPGAESAMRNRLFAGRPATIEDLFKEGCAVTCNCGHRSCTLEEFMDHQKSSKGYYAELQTQCFGSRPVNSGLHHFIASDGDTLRCSYCKKTVEEIVG